MIDFKKDLSYLRQNMNCFVNKDGYLIVNRNSTTVPYINLTFETLGYSINDWSFIDDEHLEEKYNAWIIK